MFMLWRQLELAKTIRNCSPHSLRNFNQIKVLTNRDSIAVNNEPEALETKFKSATHPMQVLSTLPSSPSEFRTISGETVIRALQTIAVLQRANQDTVKCDFITSHPKFEQLCRRLKRCSPMFTADELVKSFKFLCSLGIPTNSEISLILLNLIRHEINHLSVEKIIYLDYVLSQTKCHSELQKAIQTALPTVFNLQFRQQIDKHNTVQELVNILSYIASHDMEITDCKKDIICKLLFYKRKEIQTNDAINIIYLLCANNRLDKPNNIELMSITIRRLMDDIADVEINRLQKVIHRMVATLVAKRVNEFSPFKFHLRGLLKMCAERISQEDLGLRAALDLQRTMKNISFQSIPLLEYIGDKISSDVNSCRTMSSIDVFTIVQGFAYNCFIPQKPHSNEKIWSDQILPAILINENLAPIQPSSAVWMHFTLQLVILGHFNQELISRVLSGSYLQKYLCRKELSLLDLYKILILYQTVSMQKNIDMTGIDTKTISSICRRYAEQIPPCNIQQDLIHHMPELCVLKNVRTKHMHIIDTLLKINKKTGQVEPFTDYIKCDTDGFIALDDVPCNENEILLCIDSLKRHHLFSNARHFLYSIRNNMEESKIGTYRLRIKQLEQLGLEVCEINHLRYAARNANYIHQNILKQIIALDKTVDYT